MSSMFNIFGTRTPAQREAANPAVRTQRRARNAAAAQASLQDMAKREETLTRKAAHLERQITALKAEAKSKLGAGNRLGGVCLAKFRGDGGRHTDPLHTQPKPR